jgi:Flp pilus assembly protein TadG
MSGKDRRYEPVTATASAPALARIRRRLGGRAGQSLVETAIALPLLALLTFGLLDFGRAYYFQVAVTNAAREGSRSGILNVYTGPQTPSCSSSNNYATCPVQADTAIVNAVTAELTNTSISPKSVTICPPHDSNLLNSWTPSGGWSHTADCPTSDDRVSLWVGGATTNYYVNVNVKYDFQLYTPLLQNLVGNPVTMNVSVQMRTNY